MGDDNVGVKTGWKRNGDKAFMAAIIARMDAQKADGTFYSDMKDAKDTMASKVIDAGWVAHHGDDVHVMNAHHFYMHDIFTSINKADFDKNNFHGNGGYCRFIAVYMDAKDMAYVGGASRIDAMVAGYKAMASHYGVDAAFWAWF